MHIHTHTQNQNDLGIVRRSSFEYAKCEIKEKAETKKTSKKQKEKNKVGREKNKNVLRWKQIPLTKIIIMDPQPESLTVALLKAE